MGYNPNSYYGRALLNMIGSEIPALGDIFMVCPPTDGNYAKVLEIIKDDPFGGRRLFHTIEEAYEAVRSGNNDVIVLSDTVHTLGKVLTVTKDKVHFVGMTASAKGVEVKGAAGSVAGNVAVMINAGNNNSFRNINFIQAGTNAAQLYSFIDKGVNTYVDKCQFTHSSLATTTAVANLLMAGTDCVYENSTIGDTTIYRTGTTTNALLVGKHGTIVAANNTFNNCDFVIYSSKTASRTVGTTDNGDAIGATNFNNCRFTSAKKANGSDAGVDMAAGVVSALTNGYMYVDSNCSFFNATLAMSANASNLNAGAQAQTVAKGGNATAGA